MIIARANILFCALIFLVGLLGYKRKKDITSLLIGVAFAMFSITHILNIFTQEAVFEDAILIIRITAYCLIAVTLYVDITKR
jgi:uncharacterized membrane protein (UPF0136 family)